MVSAALTNRTTPSVNKVNRRRQVPQAGAVKSETTLAGPLVQGLSNVQGRCRHHSLNRQSGRRRCRLSPSSPMRSATPSANRSSANRTCQRPYRRLSKGAMATKQAAGKTRFPSANRCTTKSGRSRSASHRRRGPLSPPKPIQQSAGAGHGVLDRARHRHLRRRRHRECSFDIAVKFVGSDNRTYGDDCGVIPNPLNHVGALYNGGSAQGNVRGRPRRR